jgi:hypothetical protein
MARRRVGSWCAVVVLAAGAASACSGSRDHVAPAGNTPAPGVAPAADSGEIGHAPRLGTARPHAPGVLPSPGERHSGVSLPPPEAASVRPEEPPFAAPEAAPPVAPVAVPSDTPSAAPPSPSAPPEKPPVSAPPSSAAPAPTPSGAGKSSAPPKS